MVESDSGRIIKKLINVFIKCLDIRKDGNGLTGKITCFEHFTENKLLTLPGDFND